MDEIDFILATNNFSNTEFKLTAEYLRWNKAVAEDFFGSHNQDRAVFLDMEDETLERIGLKAGVSSHYQQAFYKAIRNNLFLTEQGSAMYHRFDLTLAEWRRDEVLSTPPHVALLAFFSRIAQTMHADEKFSSANYYARYVEALGLEHHESDSKRASNAYPRVATSYFQQLNNWLNAHDGRLGVPTAFSFDSRRHVGLPIAQSLMRDADRKKLESMFSSYELRPGETMSRADMQRLLNEWVPRSTLSDLLKRLWTRNNVVKQQVASVAVQELATWRGVDRDTKSEGGSIDRRMSLTTALSGFPMKSLNLALVIPAGLGLESNSLKVPRESSETAKLLLNQVGGQLDTASISTGSYTELVNSGGLEFDVLLKIRFSLFAPTLNGAIDWSPARLIVLRRDPNLPGRFIQQKRAELNNELMVLVIADLATQVSRYLESVALPGFVRHPRELEGLPSGWELFSSVFIADLADPKIEDLDPLSPETHRTRIAFEGGFRISGGSRSIWHTSSPPTILISAHNSEEAAYEITLETSALDAPVEKKLKVRTEFNGSTSIQLGPQDSSGSIRVKLFEPSTSSTSEDRVFTLVQGDQPRPVQLSGRSSLLAREMNSNGVLVAKRFNETPQTCHVIGAAITGAIMDSSSSTTITSMPVPAKIDFQDTRSDPSRIPANPQIQKKLIALDEKDVINCFTTGNHSYRLPEVGPTGVTQEQFISPCILCGKNKIHLNKGNTWTRRNYVNQSVESKIAPMLSPEKKPISEWKPATADQFLDALTYLRQGSWNDFQRLALQVDNTRDYIWNISRTLESLGHIELEIGEDGRPISWMMAPQSLVVTSTGSEAFMAGARSSTDIKHIRQIADAVGARVEISAFDYGVPSRIAIVDLDSYKLKKITEESKGLLRTQVPAELLFHSVDLRKAISQLRVKDIGYGVTALEFDPEVRKWIDSSYRPRTAGAYKFGKWQTWYGFDDGECLRQADYRVVKHLSARIQNQPLISYDKDIYELRVALGAELPGIFDRVAVLCSGIPAEKHPEKPWIVVYRAVPADIAGLIFNKIYGGR